jgi:sugar phosphate isomerase/epimerase
MKFGLTALDFPTALGSVFEGGSVDFSRFSYLRIVREAVMAGFRHIELTLDAIHALPGSLSREKINELSKLKRDLGFTLSAHLPLWAVEPACFNERIRAASVSTCADAITQTEELEPLYYVFHSTGALAAEFSRLPFPDYSLMINAAMASFALQSIRELLEKTGIDPRRIGLESVEFPLELTAAMAEETGCSLVLDTGHVLAGFSGRVSLSDAVKIFAPRLIGMHLHDGSRRNGPDGSVIVRDHMALGKGDMDVRGLLEALGQGGFEGPAVFELSRKDALSSLEVVRHIAPDIVE